ncbi:hypothetical protein CEXT_766141 [Caerostris extrusa]|uniref:Uncharacterized protein n=1 Tax=Caerostris extrusa TaxID=172846 RepID=A0AAV4W0E9_CAEEX|nr:hypothetical protein CEXT_766141 [Caerostris extrusa]
MLQTHLARERVRLAYSDELDFSPSELCQLERYQLICNSEIHFCRQTNKQQLLINKHIISHEVTTLLSPSSQFKVYKASKIILVNQKKFKHNQMGHPWYGQK